MHYPYIPYLAMCQIAYCYGLIDVPRDVKVNNKYVTLVYVTEAYYVAGVYVRVVYSLPVSVHKGCTVALRSPCLFHRHRQLD